MGAFVSAYCNEKAILEPGEQMCEILAVVSFCWADSVIVHSWPLASWKQADIEPFLSVLELHCQHLKRPFNPSECVRRSVVLTVMVCRRNEASQHRKAQANGIFFQRDGCQMLGKKLKDERPFGTKGHTERSSVCGGMTHIRHTIFVWHHTHTHTHTQKSHVGHICSAGRAQTSRTVSVTQFQRNLKYLDFTFDATLTEYS